MVLEVRRLLALLSAQMRDCGGEASMYQQMTSECWQTDIGDGDLVIIFAIRRPPSAVEDAYAR
jgi:hypothetical protein